MYPNPARGTADSAGGCRYEHSQATPRLSGTGAAAHRMIRVTFNVVNRFFAFFRAVAQAIH